MREDQKEKKAYLYTGQSHKGAYHESLDWHRARIGQRHDRLRDDAAGTATSSGIDGTRGGFNLGGGRDDGEERSEGIH